MKAAAPSSQRARLRLRLYVAGRAPNSVQAATNIRALCEQHFPLGYDLEIVDLLDDPATALADGIVVTPTLVKLHPRPREKVIGNLSDASKVLLLLGGR